MNVLTTQELGRLQRVDPRTVWLHEGLNFTPWLALEENLLVLADALGIELRLESQEQAVGPFRADIVCVEPLSGHKVLIENQLEKTDHIHLGQVITYAAGLDAVTVVWISTRFTDEHRAAVDWLNTISGEDYRFFALEIELWQIGTSPPAPKFNVVAQPNNWSKTVKAAPSSTPSTSTWSYEYWSGFKDVLQARAGITALGKPADQYYLRLFRYGKDQVVYAYYNTAAKRIGIQLWFGGPYWRAYLAQLQEVPDIEHELGPIAWTPAKQSGSAYFQINGVDARSKADWPQQYDLLLARISKLRSVLDERVPRFTEVVDTPSDSMSEELAATEELV